MNQNLLSLWFSICFLKEKLKLKWKILSNFWTNKDFMLKLKILKLS
jgi:hypothetical protein